MLRREAGRLIELINPPILECKCTLPGEILKEAKILINPPILECKFEMGHKDISNLIYL